MREMTVHRCMFYKPSVSTVNSVAVDITGRRLAVLRGTQPSPSHCVYVIEIWSTTALPHLTLCLELWQESGSSTEALAFSGESLMAVSRDGSLRQYSLTSLRVMCEKQVSASPLWCIASHESSKRLALGCDDGQVHIVAVANDGFEIVKQVKTSLNGRLMCVGWSEDGTKLVGGASNCIQVWDVHTGNTLANIHVANKSAKVGTIVWTLHVTRDMVVISGDSRGVVSMWDASTSTLICEHEMHKADVLAVAYDQTTDTLLASGIDPKLQFFAANVKGKLENNRKEWNPTFVRRIHTHDVRALAALPNSHFVSGGLDSSLCVTHPQGITTSHMPPFHKCIGVSYEGHSLLLQYMDNLQLWTLDKNGIVDVEPDVSFSLQIRTKGERIVTCSAIHANGKLIAYCDALKTAFVRVNQTCEGGDGVLIDGLGKVVCRVLAFNSDSQREMCVLGDVDGNLHLIGIEALEGNVQASHRLMPEYGVATKIAVNETSTRIAVATSSKHVLVMDMQFKTIATVPRLDEYPVDVTLRGANGVLVLYAGGRLVEFDIENEEYSKLSRNLPAFTSLNPHSILVSRADSKRVFLVSEGSINLLDVQNGKITPIGKEWDIICGVGVKKENSGNESLVVVSMNPQQYTKSLPPALYVKTFGTG